MQDSTVTDGRLTAQEQFRRWRRGSAMPRTPELGALIDAYVDRQKVAAAATRGGLHKPVHRINLMALASSSDARSERVRNVRVYEVAGRWRVWAEELPYQATRNFRSRAEADEAAATFQREGLERFKQFSEAG